MSNKKLLLWLSSVAFIVYTIIVIIFINQFVTLSSKYQKMDRAYSNEAEKKLQETLLSSDQLTQQLDQLIKEYPMEIIVKKKDKVLYETIILADHQLLNGVLNTDLVSIESQGYIGDITEEYFVWYSIYHMQDRDYLQQNIMFQNILILAILFILWGVLILLQYFLMKPLYRLKDKIQQINQYELDEVDVETGNDEINYSFNKFVVQLRNNIYSVSRRHTALETALQIERERLNNTIVVTKALVHDLKSPIHQVRIENEDRANHLINPNDETIEVIEYNMKALDQVLRDVNEVLKLLQTNVYDLDKEVEEFNLTEIIESTIKIFHQSLVSKKLSIDFDCPAEAFIVANKVTCKLMIHNILSNAVQYAKEATEINITLQNQVEQLELSVTNKTAEHNMKRMRASEQLFNVIEETTTKEHVYSSGNGLYLIKDLAIMIGGTYESVFGEGVVKIKITINKKDVNNV